MVSAELSQREIVDLVKRLNKVSRGFKKPKERRKMLREASRPVINAAREIAPVGEKPVHYRYSTPKLSKGKRAPKGQGKIVASYRAGNLQGAVRALALRKTARVFIGPRIAKTSRGSKGKFGPGTGRFDAYYAQMVYGSAVAFRSRVMIPALIKATSNVKAILRAQVERLAEELARKNGL